VAVSVTDPRRVDEHVKRHVQDQSLEWIVRVLGWKVHHGPYDGRQRADDLENDMDRQVEGPKPCMLARVRKFMREHPTTSQPGYEMSLRKNHVPDRYRAQRSRKRRAAETIQRGGRSSPTYALWHCASCQKAQRVSDQVRR